MYEKSSALIQANINLSRSYKQLLKQAGGTADRRETHIYIYIYIKQKIPIVQLARSRTRITL